MTSPTRILFLTTALLSILLLTDCGRIERRSTGAVQEVAGEIPGGYGSAGSPPPAVNAVQPQPQAEQAAPQSPRMPVRLRKLRQKPRESMPSDMGAPFDAAPQPRSASSSRIALPPGVGVVRAPKMILPPQKTEYADSGLPWVNIGEYDAVQPSLPGGSAPRQEFHKRLSVPIVYDDVNIYPVDGDASSYEEDLRFTYIQPEPPNSPYPDPLPVPLPPGISSPHPAEGTLREEVFFPYGSSSLDKKDRNDLKELGSNLSRQEKYEVLVVGHASKKVNGIQDPVKRKMINFAIAQKRANAVAGELGKTGVKPNWVMAISKGEEEPNPAPGKRDQESADRRAAVYVAGERDVPEADNNFGFPPELARIR